MSVVCRSYATEDEARSAVDRLLDAGVPGEGVRVLRGSPARDVRTEEVGEFAGSIAPDAPIGDFAGAPHERRTVAGSFAAPGVGGRKGSFADADRETVTTYPAGVQHMHVEGHRHVRRLLIEAGLDAAAAERDIAALHEGRVLVLADLEPAQAEALLA